MKRFALAAAVLAATSAAVAFAQQGPKPEDEIRYRQSVMNVIGRAMGPMGAMAQGKAAFNAAVVQKNSALIDSLIGLHWNSFGPGTDKGAPTKADPKVWSEAPKFKKLAEDVQKAVAHLAAESKSGDEAKFKAAFGEVGKACKACHDDFRTKEFRS
ncbi:MAG TPA: cytochrome c [Usitatibacteraceae bacterium]|nr:cytochrome c [Usitatibacteraceae bacterium]